LRRVLDNVRQKGYGDLRNGQAVVDFFKCVYVLKSFAEFRLNGIEDHKKQIPYIQKQGEMREHFPFPLNGKHPQFTSKEFQQAPMKKVFGS